MGQHGFFGVFGSGVHQAQRIVSAGRPCDGVRAAATPALGHGCPGVRLGALECIDAAPVRAAVGVKNGGTASCRPKRRMKGDTRIHVVVIALGGVYRLRAAHFLRRLTHKLEGALDPVFLHDRLGGQEATKRAQTER